MTEAMNVDTRDFGHYMPGEWAAHSGCWMAWPCREGLWANAAATRQDYANLANTIARFHPVRFGRKCESIHLGSLQSPLILVLMKNQGS